MERVYLEWNIVNWITVLLMVGVGMSVVGFISSAIQGSKEKAKAA